MRSLDTGALEKAPLPQPRMPRGGTPVWAVRCPAFPTRDDDAEGKRAKAAQRKMIQVLPSVTNTKLLCYVNT